MLHRLFTMKQTFAIGKRCLNQSSFPIVNEAFIDGKWVSAGNKETFPVFNPATNEKITEVPAMGVDDVQTALSASSKAFQNWKNTTEKERSALLRKWFEKIEEDRSRLRELMHLEAGKPLAEADAEITYGNSFIEWFSEEARRSRGEVVCSPDPRKTLLHVKQPVGVAALITPWNFPLAMITRKAGAALAAGCTCIIKPAEDTPLTALALADLADKAGFPSGVINVVTCPRKNAADVGRLLCTSPLTSVITFTGSTQVGKTLYNHCSEGVKRISLELGGNAPFIVFSSANIETAVKGACVTKFRNCGQTCISANRFLIQSDVFVRFIDELTRYITHNLGVGFECEASRQQLGPLINESQMRKVDDIVKDAVSKGAKIVLGGNKASGVGQLFYEPTVLTNIGPSMRCYKEEIFGPVIACIPFKDEAQALSIANDSNSGLAGYLYTEDMSQAFRAGKALEVGMVGINEAAISTPEAAFGGVKESGLGREGSHHGLEEFLNIKYMCIGNL